MKKFITLLLLIMSSLSFAGQGSSAATNNESIATAQGGLDDEVLEWFNEFFSQFSDEQLQEFAEAGEKFIADEMSKGKDIDTIINEVFEPFETMPTDQLGKSEQPTALPTPTPLPVMPIDAKRIDEARVLLKTIVDKIEAVRHRAEQDRKTRDLLKPWRFNLDDLIYYMHQLSQEKLIKYLSDKEFSDLFEIVRQLAQDLNFYEPLFQIQEMTLEVENPYEILGISRVSSIEDVQARYQQLLSEKKPEVIKKKMADEGKSADDIKRALENVSIEREAITQSYSTILAQERSRQALQAILDSLSRAIYTDDFFGKIKKLLQKYEPEALKIKEAQEKREAAARKEQEELLKKRPTWTPIVRDALVDFSAIGTPSADKGVPVYHPTYPTGGGFGTEGGAGAPGIPSTPGKPGEKAKFAADKKEKKEEKAKEGEKKEADKKAKRKVEVPKKVADKYKKVESSIDSLSKYLDETPQDRSEVNPFATTVTKDIFKNFKTMLQQPLPVPHTEGEPEFAKVKAINKILVEIIKKLNDFKREIRDLKDMNKQEKTMLKKAAADKFDKFSKEYLEKSLLNLVTATSTKDLPKEKKYIFFGINEYGNDGKDINKDDYKAIIKLNEPQTHPVDGVEVTEPINFVQQLKESLEAIKKELKVEKR